MNGRPRTWHRLRALALCAATALLLSGCVYLRLLLLKHQLGDFNRNFAVKSGDGLRLVCFNPVLLADDLHWLGIQPEKTTRKGRNEQWWVHWVKERNSGGNEPEPAAQDLELEIDFTNDKLTGFFIAERYFAFIPKNFLIGVIRGLGNASIDKGNRSVSADIALANRAGSERPTISSLAGLLGTPTARREEGGKILLRYRYLPPTPGTKNGDFDLLFVFDAANGELRRMEGTSPVGQMALTFPSGAETSAVPSR